MKPAVEISIEGIGVFAPGLPNWQIAREVLIGAREHVDAPTRPAPSLLAPNERRRAPESVLLALDIAEQACSMAGREPRDLPNVFASAYGDLAISDYLCKVLAEAPRDLSPTKFHNSVHNAPAGYWTIAAGCMATSSALSAGETTFAAGLLEASLLACSESTAVLLAAFDIAAAGPLADLIPCRAPFGVAFVISPVEARDCARVRMSLRDGGAPDLAPQSPALQALHAANPASASLPLLAALARRTPIDMGFELAARGLKQKDPARAATLAGADWREADSNEHRSNRGDVNRHPSPPARIEPAKIDHTPVERAHLHLEISF